MDRDAEDKKAMPPPKTYPAPRIHPCNWKHRQPKPNPDLIDFKSICGKFGWLEIERIPIPYLFRGEETYAAVRIIDSRLLNKFNISLTSKVFSCYKVTTHTITEAEASLLNEINIIHCDSLYGEEVFTIQDKIINTRDIEEIYNFLKFCYSKLVNSSVKSKQRCGFISINCTSTVPYVFCGVEKYLPLFYFEAENNLLESRARKIVGWDLAYMKFCLKYQGVKESTFDHDSLETIAFKDIKKYFPPDTKFSDVWPEKKSELLSSNDPLNTIKPLNPLKGAIQKITFLQHPGNLVIPVDKNKQTFPNGNLNHFLVKKDSINFLITAKTSYKFNVAEPDEKVSKDAFRLFKILVNGVEFNCVNSKPNDFALLFVTVEEFRKNYFGDVKADTFNSVLVKLGFDFFKPNSIQAGILVKNGVVSNPNSLMICLSIGLQSLQNISFLLKCQ